MSTSFRRMASVTASTRRSPPVGPDGQRGGPVPYLAEIMVTPIDPADSQRARDLAFRLQQETNRMFEILQTFTEATNDVREGDVLVTAKKHYAVRGVAEWTWRNREFLHLLLEEVKP